MKVKRLELCDWALGLYTLLAILFWVLALGPGGGGTSEVEVGWTGALINGLLLIPLWKGRPWVLPLLALGTLGLAVGIALGGLPPDGPMFGALAGVAAIMFVLLCGLGYAGRDTGDDFQTT